MDDVGAVLSIRARTCRSAAVTRAFSIPAALESSGPGEGVQATTSWPASVSRRSSSRTTLFSPDAHPRGTSNGGSGPASWLDAPSGIDRSSRSIDAW